jgi:hypothetical protein
MARRKETYLKGHMEHRRTQRDYMAGLLEAVTLEDWRSVVTATVAAAKAGDASARAWLAHYLVGKPAATALTPLTIVVQQLSGHDPVVDALAHLHMERLTFPGIHADVENAVKAEVANELQALEEQNSSQAARQQ